jgi:hypothetical protein
MCLGKFLASVDIQCSKNNSGNEPKQAVMMMLVQLSDRKRRFPAVMDKMCDKYDRESMKKARSSPMRLRYA